MLNLHLCVRRSGVLGVEMRTLPVKSVFSNITIRFNRPLTHFQYNHSVVALTFTFTGTTNCIVSMPAERKEELGECGHVKLA